MIHNFAVVILAFIVITIIAAGVSVAMSGLKEELKQAMKLLNEEQDLLKEIHKDSEMHLAQWGVCLEKWKVSVDVTNDLLEMLKQKQEGK